MGTPDFAVPALEKLIASGHEVGLVVTQPDRKRSRGKVSFSPVKETAVRHGIPVLQPVRLSRSEEDKNAIADYAPDVIVVAAYGQILKKDVLDIPALGCFNIHGSLLPKLRGASPIQHAILEGYEKTGVTIMKMGEGLDDGDMVLKAETPIEKKNYSQLADELSRLGADLLLEALPLIEDGTVEFQAQNDEDSTYAPLLSKSDGKIDFSRKPEEIERQVRAFDPWPGAFFEYNGGRMKIWKAECPGEATDAADGTVVAAGPQGIDVACGGALLRVTELQLPGKKRVSAKDYLLGHKLEPGTSFAAG